MTIYFQYPAKSDRGQLAQGVIPWGGMHRSWLHHTGSGLKFVLANFVPPIAFFAIFEWVGAKPAIGAAVVLTLAQLSTQLALRHKLSPFFLTASTFTVLFGSMDFLAREPRFFRLAPFAENFALGLIFGATVALGKPIASWFAEALPAQLRPDLSGDIGHYLRKVTIAWVIYFFAKSGVFLYLAFHVDLGELVVLRSIIGGVSLAAMFGGEIFYRKRLRRAPLR